jgi:hypothetical protein
MQTGGALVLTGAGTLWSSTQTPTLRHATIGGPPLPGSSAALTYGHTVAATGNLAVGTSSGQIAFQTNTNNTSAAPETPGQTGFDYLAVQNDGNLKLYDPFGLRALWASETLQVGAKACPAPGQVLSPAY